jgi:hypothetical protein
MKYLTYLIIGLVYMMYQNPNNLETSTPAIPAIELQNILTQKLQDPAVIVGILAITGWVFASNYKFKI